MADYTIDWDASLPGFGTRTTANGVSSFILNYRNRSGRERRLTLGRCKHMSKTEARARAKELKARIDAGDDPQAERVEFREAPTVADLCQRYAEEHLPKKRPASQVEDRAMIRDYILTELAHLKVAEVAFCDISRLHHKITRAGKPIRANRTVALLSKLFSLAVRWGMRADNPCKGVEKNPEQGRERYLEGEEIARLMKALSELEDQESANAIMLALLTGARRGEILQATWEQFDLRKGVWTKPSSHTKQKRVHSVRLSRQARDLLKAMHTIRASTEKRLFPGRIYSDGTASIRPAWEKARELAGLPDVRFHDLRHSFASFLVSEGVSLPMIGKLLGHTQAQTTLRYAHAHDDALAAAANLVGSVVTRK
jgi:integrase